MSFYPPNTVLHEDNNIRYQIYSDEFFESTLENVIESRIVEGSIYSDFGIDRSIIEQASRDFINESVIRIIAIDTALDNPIVVGSIFAEDFSIFEASQHTHAPVKRLQILKLLNRKLMSPISTVSYKKGDIVIGSGYGVKKDYQDLKIGTNLGILFLSVCLDSPYKVFCGLFYSRKASSIMARNGGFLMCQLQVQNCTDIDPDVATYMKNDIEIVAYVDANKDSAEFQKLKLLCESEEKLQIQ